MDSVRMSLLSGAASLVGSYGSSRIGQAFHGGNLDPFSQALLHGALGATSAAIMGGEPLAGAIGAVIGEIVGGAYREGAFGNTPLDQNSASYADQVEYGVAFAKMAAVLAVGLTGGDVNAAAFTAENAARYNSLAIVRNAIPALAASTGAALLDLHNKANQSPQEREAALAQAYAQGAAIRSQEEPQAQEYPFDTNDYSFMNMPIVDNSFTTPSDSILLPYCTPRTSSIPFGDAQNTNSCLYRAPVSQKATLSGFTPLPNLGPQILWTPLPEHTQPLPGLTSIPNLGPQILSTPIPESPTPLPGFTILPTFLGPQTLSTPIHDAPNILTLCSDNHGSSTNSTSQSIPGTVQEYDVGLYGPLSKQSKGDGLEVHHAPQKHPAKQVVSGYDEKLAPAIVLSRPEHADIPNKRGEYAGSDRDLLANDIRNLRNYTKAPNSKLRELINLAKETNPNAYKK